MSMHRARALALSVRADDLVLRAIQLTRDSDRIRAEGRALRLKLRDLQRDGGVARKPAA